MSSYFPDNKPSPMMAQWHACKKNAPDAVLLFRLGDFYEAFYEDAAILSKELDLTLTKRQEVPMSGVPYHASEGYIDKLVAKGYRVAIVEQVEDPKQVKGLVKREIVRVVTPGTLVNSTLLSEKSNNFLACITQLNQNFGLAVLDLTTAEFRTMELEESKELMDELCRLRPAEILTSEKFAKHHASFLDESKRQLKCTLTVKHEGHFDYRITSTILMKHFHVQSLDGFGLKGMIAGVEAAGALLAYVQEDLNFTLDHIKILSVDTLSTYMAISHTTQRHLELTTSLHGQEKNSTLLSVLDQTVTPMGARLLKFWITHPLVNSAEIRKRQDAIEAFYGQPERTASLSTVLKEVRDLERLLMRIETSFASPRDLLALASSLEQLPEIKALLHSLEAELIQEDTRQLHDLAFLSVKIKSALVDSPPLRLTEGGIFKQGYHPELDTLLALKNDSHDWIAHYQNQLRETTGIKTLRVSFTKAFGYYIEVSRGQADKMPESFQRRQTLVNAERFISPELKEYEYKVLTAEERASALEYELFQALRQEIISHAGPIRQIARALARIDTLAALAVVAQENRYVRPLIDESFTLQILEGRHPVIESCAWEESFIPNDVLLNEHNRLLLITGPNMAGKSTFMRQVALIAIMAQIGSFVPAKKVHMGIIDKVFSRIGAHDDLSRGQSTFMVEMAETANILHNATSRSLVILDEIGRGTSTYDGISIAWAVAENLLATKERSPKTLFATHYWELTQLEKEMPGAVNFHVAVQEAEKEIVFLHKILKGSTDKSYGIHVARLAGLPSSVLQRAQEMLVKLEKKKDASPIPLGAKHEQLNLFTLLETPPSLLSQKPPTPPLDPCKQQVLTELEQVSLDHLSPIEAHRKLAEWQTLLQNT